MQETHAVDMLKNYTPQGIAVHILIWDPGIGVLGSSAFDRVEFRVEWLLGELTEIPWPLIILLIKSYLVSHRWIWDPGIICSWIQ